jgi:beta-glucosidase
MHPCRYYLRIVPGALVTLVLASAAPSSRNDLAEVPRGASDQGDPLPDGIPPLPSAHATWPRVESPIALDPAQEARIAAIVGGMTLEQKVGQMTQADALRITPDDVRRFYIGSVMVGGDGWPSNDRHAPASAWLAISDRLWDASMSTDAKVKIPILWGIDAVHGDARIYGTTIFPHNIGLGAAHDPGLVRRIGEATAQQMRATGHDWAFSPCVAVTGDLRWGRTYEGFSENPAITRIYAQEMVAGLQNLGPTPDPDRPFGVVATAKHFLGDGGTDRGVDEGVSLATKAELINVHAQGYFGAIGAGVQSVMVSYSSWLEAPARRPSDAEIAEAKVHGSKYLLTSVLKGAIGFDGLVVSDLKGHGQVPGCSASRCARAINAGIDVFMVAEDWREFFSSTVDLVRRGEVPMARIDDAVTRILRVKMRMGFFDMPRPSERPNARDTARLLHHALAAEAVQKSLVLLKNNRHVLPLDPGARILVVGKSADRIANQAGGWSIDWQGTSNTNLDFPAGSSILDGIRQVASPGNVSFSEYALGVDVTGFDAVIAVIGEAPYSEFFGDLSCGRNPRCPHTMEHARLHPADLEVLSRVSGKGKPVVTIFLSGRPLVTTKELNRSDAFVAAWLLGTEGAAVAPVLFRGQDGKPARDFTGKLPISWPRKDCPSVAGKTKTEPLFPFGYGLNYANMVELPVFAEPKSTDCR